MKTGELRVYTGPMFAGKTSALIAELESTLEDNKKVLVIKPIIDNRFSESDIVSHDGVSLQEKTGHSVLRLGIHDVPDLSLIKDVDVILIDEAQFFTKLCDTMVSTYLESGINVIAVGLDLDSSGRPFKGMSYLLALANAVYKLTGICSICGNEATRTFRKLSSNSFEQILIGGAETYEPRCLNHWAEGQKENYDFLLTVN